MPWWRRQSSARYGAPVIPPRALIVTVYGLYARESSGWLPISGLVRLLAELDVDESAVRSATSRLKRRGVLEASRRDGAAGYGLSRAGREILAEGDEHIFTPPEGRLADGWLLAVFSVPEAERAKRHMLRSQLAALGFGTAAPGVWIAPAHRYEVTRSLLRRLDLASYVDMFTGHYHGEVDARWWDLDAVRRRYERFLATWRKVDPASAGGVARVVELGADLVGVGVVDLFEDGQCSLPRVASRVDLAGGLVRLAEAGQRAGLVVAVAEVPVRDQGLLVVLGGLGVVPEVVVGVAEAVPRVGLPVAVAARRPCREGLLAVGQRLLVVAQLRVVPADVVQRAGHAGRIAAGPKQVEGLPGMAERVGEAPLPFEHPAEAQVGVGRSGVVAQRGVQLEGLLEMGVGVAVAVQPDVREAEAAVGVGLPRLVTQATRGREGGALGGHPVVPVSLHVQERRVGPGELPGVRVQPGVGGVPDSGEQDRVFGGEPGHSVVLVGGRLRGDPRASRDQRDRIALRIEQPVAGERGVQVVVEHPQHRLPPVGVGVKGVRLLGGVGAQQVVKGEPTGCVLIDEARGGQLGEEPGGVWLRERGEAGGGRAGDVRAGAEAEQPEQPGRVTAQRLVRPGERRAGVAGRVATVERVEATSALPELLGERAEGEPGPGSGAGGDDAQRERQPRAVVDELVRRRRLRRDQCRAEVAGEQLAGLGGGEQAERDRVGAVAGDQAGEPVAAGHQRQAAHGSRQQRADLFDVAGVVEHDQHPAPGEQAAIEVD